ncbi:YihY/virulence factor BrkB family protein [Leifsonia sp. F6_8S_P_1B]|uniref:YihY/virulence factor BrkB family protein n=1 Tax=Leifsonia williamsii TaxID=3035919 RepID=A0ABT8K959_9MICO|nr:YihY/virulence factor BrkB family protein [Leifsonia williamsii]MDN4613985.1 YihY/virulence factor BrkB family protein [Leifsonia williamsii]
MSEIGASERLADAPHPEDSRKPGTPTKLEKPSWKHVFKRTVREFSTDQCTDMAAALTYFGVLSLFPGILALVSLLGVIGQGKKAADQLLQILQQVAPGSTAQLLREPIQNAVNSPAAGISLVLGIVLAIWSASGYVGAFSRAMNRIYEIDEGRPFWKLRPTQLLVTVITLVLVGICAVILVVSGPVTRAIGDALGLGTAPQVVWEIVKWPLLLVIVVLVIAVLYYATPNAKQPRFRWISMGAIIAILVLAVATFLFGLYVATFANYAKTYGSLAGVIVFLLWVWIANLALLFGAEFDAETERGRQLQAGMEAEETIQLPPRDTAKSEKSAYKEEKLVDEARTLRTEAARNNPESKEN